MTCTANATKIAKPVRAARMMYVLVLTVPRYPWAAAKQSVGHE
jgi:hypothetical protein